MKTSNLALRLPDAELPDTTPAPTPPAIVPAPQWPGEPDESTPRNRPRPRFDRRIIEIRDQGLAPFRVR